MALCLKPSSTTTAARPSRTVWLINLFFGPGAAPTGRLLESLAVALDADGWDVTAICGTADYRPGVFAAAPRFTGRVRRLWCWPTRAGSLSKLLTWGTFTARLIWFLVWSRLPDVIITQTTPPFLHVWIAFRNLFAFRKTQVVLWNQDTYPDYLVAAGWLRPGSFLLRGLQALANWGGRRTDLAIALDGAMQQKLLQQGCRHVHVIPNWEPVSASAAPLPAAEPQSLPPELLRAAEGYRVKLAYTGNLGVGHEFEWLWSYLRNHPQQRDFHLFFVGAGERTAAARELASREGWTSVSFWPYLPAEQFAAFLGWIDWGLITLSPACAGVMSPSKLHAWLAAGKPVLFWGPQSANVAETILAYECGVVLDPQAPEAFSGWVSNWATTTNDLTPLQAAAIAAYQQRHSETAAWNAWRNLLAPGIATPS